jgi:hypothetical protein
MRTLKKWDDTGCCEESRGLVYWMPKGLLRKFTGKFNPPKTGWAMSVDDETLVNVMYCPFCGKKLSTLMEGPDAKRTTTNRV